MTKYIEHVVVRDYGKQGLAVFDMTGVANPGFVSGWTTLADYASEPRGFRPSLDVPYTYGECAMSYYLQGVVVRPGTTLWRELGVDAFLERYKAFALTAYCDDEDDIELELVVVLKDQQKYRNERWKR